MVAIFLVLFLVSIPEHTSHTYPPCQRQFFWCMIWMSTLNLSTCYRYIEHFSLNGRINCTWETTTSSACPNSYVIDFHTKGTYTFVFSDFHFFFSPFLIDFLYTAIGCIKELWRQFILFIFADWTVDSDWKYKLVGCRRLICSITCNIMTF